MKFFRITDTDGEQSCWHGPEESGPADAIEVSNLTATFLELDITVRAVCVEQSCIYPKHRGFRHRAAFRAWSFH